MSYVVTVPPATEPLTLTEVKAHLRVDGADSDTLLTAQIQAAREHAETYLNRALITQTVQARYDYFTEDMYVPKPNLQSVTSVKYIDTNGVEQTLNATLYKVDTFSVPGRIVPAYGEIWPSVRNEINAITIEYVAGYADADAVPQAIKQALLLHIGHMFENREEATPVQVFVVPMGYERVVSAYKVWRFE